jgi:hypothetical protein
MPSVGGTARSGAVRSDKPVGRLTAKSSNGARETRRHLIQQFIDGRRRLEPSARHLRHTVDHHPLVELGQVFHERVGGLRLDSVLRAVRRLEVLQIVGDDDLSVNVDCERQYMAVAAMIGHCLHQRRRRFSHRRWHCVLHGSDAGLDVVRRQVPTVLREVASDVVENLLRPVRSVKAPARCCEQEIRGRDAVKNIRIEHSREDRHELRRYLLGMPF